VRGSHKCSIMMRSLLIASLALLVAVSNSPAQKIKKKDKVVLANLQREVSYLADDKLEGRRAGSPGEKLASDFIISEFRQIGLEPKGDSSDWLQAFDIYDGRQISEAHFLVNEKELMIDKEFFPLAFSASKTIEGSPAIALQESGVPWFIDLKDILEPNQNNPHFSLSDALRAKVKECEKKGATAVIFYNSSKLQDNISFNVKDRSAANSIPVLYLTREAKRKYMKDESASFDLKIEVNITEKWRKGHNVIGYLNNGASATVILGAHYDHLGYGEDGNSLYAGTDKQIHNGADDNASGTAALIELARWLKQSKSKSNNFLFIAFSGEELGLFGSKYFTEHPTVDLSKANYMINMDMVGRLNDSTHALTIGGFGTSPMWGTLLNTDPDNKYFKIRYDSSGVGPSDYTSFYKKDIPVLFFFTGTHSDYHKPTDDADKINYTGELFVVKYIEDLLGNLDGKGKLAFTKTREVQGRDMPHFSVTLGIMPDYSFSGDGVRIDGISEGRPAQKAGLKVGDVIVKLGDYSVSSLENYMEALSKFKKGDKTVVGYKRGNDSAVAEVQFNQ
ncbi:MAG TPA: M20/M25/M40 family metallo-hydrolase, partial [Puia sp.]|nr:M20/M25/M40 family metallo-hydrolase [Puia sp.]